MTAERRRRYNVRVQGKEDIIDDLGVIALLDDGDPPSGKAIAITLAVVAAVFIVCLAL